MKNKPGTLVILTPGFPSDEADTACLPAQQVFVKALNRNFPGLRVVLVSFEYPHRRDIYSWYGNTVHAVGGWKNGWGNKLRTCLKVWRILAALQRDNDVLGLLSFWCAGCALVGKYYANWKKLRHFAWILGQDARRGNRFIPLIRPKGQQLVAMSPFLAAEFYRNYRIAPLHVIPNGVDPSLFAPVAQATGRDIDILGVGSLTTLKQYDLFVTVISELSMQVPNIRGVICGKGPEQQHLQQEIGRLGLEGNITLVGEKSHQAAIRLMEKARILLHTSSYEGFSTVCLEALYAGAHVISFCDALGRPVNNWHVVADIDEMVSVALGLLQDPLTANQRVELYTMDDSAREMMGLFDYKDSTIR